MARETRGEKHGPADAEEMGSGTATSTGTDRACRVNPRILAGNRAGQSNEADGVETMIKSITLYAAETLALIVLLPCLLLIA